MVDVYKTNYSAFIFCLVLRLGGVLKCLVAVQLGLASISDKTRYGPRLTRGSRPEGLWVRQHPRPILISLNGISRKARKLW